MTFRIIKDLHSKLLGIVPCCLEGNRVRIGAPKFDRSASIFMQALFNTVRMLIGAGLFWLLLTPAGHAQEKLDFDVQHMGSFGRIVLTFTDRLDIPEYQVRSENGVLSIQFDAPVSVSLPDVPVVLPEYVMAARIDPDSRGVRLGLTGEFRLNKIEAGEQVYIDLLPLDWAGLLPSLPTQVIARLAARALDATEEAARLLRVEITEARNPELTLAVGRHQTFVRATFDWNIDTVTEFSREADAIALSFPWPIDLDLYALQSNLPIEIESLRSEINDEGSEIHMQLAEGVVARFYKNSSTQYVLDIDRLEPELGSISVEDLLAAALAEQAEIQELAVSEVESLDVQLNGPEPVPETDQVELTPEISLIGSTVRLLFPFEIETPAAVFRRGDLLWMVFDSATVINAPVDTDILAGLSTDFTVVSAGETQIVRLRVDRGLLASLGSQGQGWIVSIGDLLLDPTDPIRLNRRQRDGGQFEIAADLGRPAVLHSIRDPEVGDVLRVVTMFPPARGVVRDLNFVDFQTLRSVHGLVVRPIHEQIDIALTRHEATIGVPDGLTISSFVESRASDSGSEIEQRRGFISLVEMEDDNLGRLSKSIDDLMREAALAEGGERESRRLELAQTLLANQLAYEALGTLQILEEDAARGQISNEVLITKAAANLVAFRPTEALEVLNSNALSEEVDALMWRAMARGEVRDFAGARVDVLASEGIVQSYPSWVRARFLISGILTAVETGDVQLANRLSDEIVHSELTPDQSSAVELLQGRLDELDRRFDEALDTYGRVISHDIRPTRSEAIYRTISLLDRMDRLDDARASATLYRESILWRGGPLEALMLKLLANLQFRSGDFRGGFATVREAAGSPIETEDVVILTAQAQTIFSDLYLNGEADGLEAIDALTLFYDYRHLTPAGARGDEMIRNLARRLIRVDLLEQAAELLDYQIESRLEGAARAQIAADLAIIYIADREPEQALQALNRTGLANLPPSLDRQRRILEARALIDAGRSELALDILRRLDGRDADSMRIDAFWRDGSYRDAAEQIELIYSRQGIPVELAQAGRLNLVRAGVGYVLSNDVIGLARLREKYSEVMSQSPEWPMFDFVTGPISKTSVGFRDLASEIANMDSLSLFLTSYRLTYEADGALAPTVSGAAQSI